MAKPMPKFKKSKVPSELTTISPLLILGRNSWNPLTTFLASNHTGDLRWSKILLSKSNPLYVMYTESATVGLSPEPSLKIS